MPRKATRKNEENRGFNFPSTLELLLQVSFLPEIELFESGEMESLDMRMASFVAQNDFDNRMMECTECGDGTDSSQNEISLVFLSPVWRVVATRIRTSDDQETAVKNFYKWFAEAILNKRAEKSIRWTICPDCCSILVLDDWYKGIDSDWQSPLIEASLWECGLCHRSPDSKHFVSLPEKYYGHPEDCCDIDEVFVEMDQLKVSLGYDMPEVVGYCERCSRRACSECVAFCWRCQRRGYGPDMEICCVECNDRRDMGLICDRHNNSSLCEECFRENDHCDQCGST